MENKMDVLFSSYFSDEEETDRVVQVAAFFGGHAWYLANYLEKSNTPSGYLIITREEITQEIAYAIFRARNCEAYNITQVKKLDFPGDVREVVVSGQFEEKIKAEISDYKYLDKR